MFNQCTTSPVGEGNARNFIKPHTEENKSYDKNSRKFVMGTTRRMDRGK